MRLPGRKPEIAALAYLMTPRRRSLRPALGARDLHLADQDRRRLDAAAERHPAAGPADRLDGLQHRNQVARDRDLAYRPAELAVLDQATGRSYREVARDRVDARMEPGDRGYVEAVTRSLHELVERCVARLHHEVGGRHRRRRAVRAATAVAGGRALAATPGLGVEEEREQLAVLDQRRPPPWRAFAVERRGRGSIRVQPAVHQHEVTAGYLVVQLVREQRAPALHSVGREHAADEAGEAGGDERVEHDRAAAAFGLARSDKTERAIGGFESNGVRVDRTRVAAHADAEASHQVAALARKRRCPRVGDRRLERRAETA